MVLEYWFYWIESSFSRSVQYIYCILGGFDFKIIVSNSRQFRSRLLEFLENCIFFDMFLGVMSIYSVRFGDLLLFEFYYFIGMDNYGMWVFCMKYMFKWEGLFCQCIFVVFLLLILV